LLRLDVGIFVKFVEEIDFDFKNPHCTLFGGDFFVSE
jgi:hypothetical protein